MSELQEHGPLSERHAALVIYECLKVVATCHELGIVHGDVKPANFLLRQRMRDPLRFVERGQMSNWLKAIDFGCSQVLRGSQLHRRTGTPGSSSHLLPEQTCYASCSLSLMWLLGYVLTCV